MQPRHVIYLASGGVALYAWDRQHYVPVSGYALPDGDPAPLVAYLRQTPTAVIAIVADVIEEEHTRDSIARLGRRDQNAMLARKLARVFPRTAYRTAVVQGRRSKDPGTSRILLSGLTKAEHLRTLQGLLAAAKLPVATVCSPALLSRPLLDKLRPANPSDATLLVSRQREGSLRLSFFRGRDLVGSRLIRKSLAAPPGDISQLVRQLDESVRYFDAAFAPSASNPVDVLLLCEPGIEPAQITAEGSGHEGFRLSVPEPGEIARKLGLRGQVAPGNADQLFVELLRRHAPAGNYAPAADRRYFRWHRVRSFGKAACLALAGGALLGSGLNGMAILEVSQQTAAVRSSIAELNAQLNSRQGTDLATGADPLEMQRIANSWQLLQAHTVNPRDILVLVSNAVEKQPRVQIEGVEWGPLHALATTEPAARKDTSSDAADTASDETAVADPAESEAGLPSGEQRIRLTIRGRVEPFDGHYPLAFAEVRTFMQALRADPRVISVTARKEPLDVSPHSTLSGELTPALKTGKAAFTINVLLKITNEPA